MRTGRAIAKLARHRPADTRLAVRRTLAVVLVAVWSGQGIAQEDAAVRATASSGAAAPVAAVAPNTRFAPSVMKDIRAAVALGPTVAVVDSGLNVNHSDFNGRLAPGAYEVFGRTADVTDTLGHGTAVASMVLSQQGMMSAVLASRVLPVRIFSGSSASDQNLSDGLRYSVGRAPIVNLSLASTGPIAQAALQESVNAGQLLIIAAGNRSQAAPDWPARYAADAWANGQIIAVGAVDAANQIASFSNRAGDARSNYLVAPGVNVPGAASTGTSGRVSMSGTSAASPLVAGAAAVVLAYWPYLAANQVAGILLSTATDLGTPGVDEIYGHGMLNLSRALQPVGTTSIPLASGSAAALSAASLNPGPIAGAGLRAAALRGDLITVALDSYRRGFLFDLGAGVAAAPALGLEHIFGPADRILGFGSRPTAAGGRIMYGAESAMSGLALGAMHAYDNRARTETALAGFALAEPVAPGIELALGTAGMAHTWLGLSGTDRSGTFTLSNRALALPMLGLMPQHHHLGAGFTLDSGLHVKAGLVSSAGTAPLLAQYGPVGTPPATANAMVLEVTRSWSHGLLGVAVQQMRESSGYLGMVAGDAFRLAFAPVTTATTAFARVDVAPKWSIAAQYTNATTPSLGNTADSLISGMTAVRSTAWGIGIARDDAWTDRDRIALTLSQPLRATAGSIALDMPGAVDTTGSIVRTMRNVSLVPSGQERLVELSWTRPIGRDASLAVSFAHRSDPNHDANASAERVVALRYGWTF